MQRTRQEILEILRSRGERTVRDLAHDLGLTQMSVRLHLGVLQRDGLIASREIHQPVGRPCHVFRLTEQADDLFPKAYWRLAERLMDQVEARGIPLDGVFDRVLEQVEQRCGAGLDQAPLEQRLQSLAAALSDEGFMAEAVADGDGYLLRTCNCPYARVARSHPSLCEAECRVLGRVLGVEPERTHFRLRGDLHCTYRVPLPAAS